jgi:hypothetical protein
VSAFVDRHRDHFGAEPIYREIEASASSQQYAGRLHRLHDEKREVVIHDYIDPRLPMLVRMSDKRLLGYRLDWRDTLRCFDNRICLRELLHRRLRGRGSPFDRSNLFGAATRPG